MAEPTSGHSNGFSVFDFVERGTWSLLFVGLQIKFLLDELDELVLFEVIFEVI